MNKMRWLWLGFFILCLVVGSIGCSGTKPQLKAEPGEKPSQMQAVPSQLETATPSPKPEEAISGPMAEAPKVEKPTQPPLRAPRTEAPTPTPAPPSPPSTPSSPLPPSPPVRPPEPPKGRESSLILTMLISTK